MLPREFFRDEEICCHCGCGLLPPVESLERMYALRTILRFPLVITSSARCKKHNASVGGKRGSIHLPANFRVGISSKWDGCGWDILIKPDKHRIIYDAALVVGFRGFGYAKTFIHIDDAKRPKITEWNY